MICLLYFLTQAKIIVSSHCSCQETTFLFQLACFLKILCPSANNTELLFPWDMNYWFMRRICICCDICVFPFRNFCAQFDNRTAHVLHVGWLSSWASSWSSLLHLYKISIYTGEPKLIRDMKTRITAPVSGKIDISWSEVYN